MLRFEMLKGKTRSSDAANHASPPYGFNWVEIRIVGSFRQGRIAEI
jgi:hypothetical protein